jgi:hypothetical protein
MDSITDTGRGTVPDTKPEIIAITINKNQETMINQTELQQSQRVATSKKAAMLVEWSVSSRPNLNFVRQLDSGPNLVIFAFFFDYDLSGGLFSLEFQQGCVSGRMNLNSSGIRKIASYRRLVRI